jgi:hypothetical protein
MLIVVLVIALPTGLQISTEQSVFPACGVIEPVSQQRALPCLYSLFANSGSSANSTTAAVVVADPFKGCSELKNSKILIDSFVLLERGVCAFDTKVILAAKAKAAGVIIIDTSSDLRGAPMMATNKAEATDLTMPVVMIGKSDGNALQAAIGTAGDKVRVRLVSKAAFLGGLLLQQAPNGQEAAAKKHFRSLQLQPDNPRPYLLLGMAMHNLGQGMAAQRKADTHTHNLPAAEACYRRFLGLSAAPVALGANRTEQDNLLEYEALRRLAMVMKVKAQALGGEEGERYVEDAVDCYLRAIKLVPNEVNAPYNLGALLYNYESRIEPDPRAGARQLTRAQSLFVKIYTQERGKEQTGASRVEGTAVGGLAGGNSSCELQLLHDWTEQKGVQIEYITLNTSVSTSTTSGYPHMYGALQPRMIEGPREARELLRSRSVLLAPSSDLRHQTMLYERCEEATGGSASCLFHVVFASPKKTDGATADADQCAEDSNNDSCSCAGAIDTGPIRISGMASLIHDSCRIFVPSQGGFVPIGGLDLRLNQERVIYVQQAASAVQMSAGSFYHFMVEVLSRVVFLLPTLHADRSLKLVLPGACEGRTFVTDALVALGVPSEQWLFLPGGYTLAVLPGGELHYVDWRRSTMPMGLQYDGPFEGDVFAAAAATAAASRPGLQFSPPQMALQRVSNLLRTSLASSAQQLVREDEGMERTKVRVRVVLVSRSRRESGKGNNGRSVLNEEELLVGLRALVEETNSKGADYDLELRVFTGERATLDQSFGAFGGEDYGGETYGEVLMVVLGVHGAGLTNMLLAPPPSIPRSANSAVPRTRTAVVELMLPHPDARDYMHLAAALGFEYWGLPDLPRNAMFLDVTVDSARVCTAVAAAAASLVEGWGTVV